MTEYIDNLRRTNNGRELEAREQLASVITTCENRDYEPKTAIWGALTLLGEVSIHLAVIADAVGEETP